MKKIYLVGFRGVGDDEPAYIDEPGLIKLGHVGISFEDQPRMILGFHPTAEALAKFQSDEEVFDWLKENEPLEGTLQEDYDIFLRAYELYQYEYERQDEQEIRPEVWQMTIEVSDTDFALILGKAMKWYTDEEKFTYALPPRGKPPLPERDNCATFPRRLGLTLPEPTGQLTRYIAALKSGHESQLWKPEES